MSPKERKKHRVTTLSNLVKNGISIDVGLLGSKPEKSLLVIIAENDVVESANIFLRKYLLENCHIKWQVLPQRSKNIEKLWEQEMKEKIILIIIELLKTNDLKMILI